MMPDSEAEWQGYHEIDDEFDDDKCMSCGEELLSDEEGVCAECAEER